MSTVLVQYSLSTDFVLTSTGEYSGDIGAGKLRRTTGFGNKWGFGRSFSEYSCLYSRLLNGCLSRNPAIYAGGDSAATNGMPLAPVAEYDGKVIADNLLEGNQLKAEYHAIPTVVFTTPPLASVGVSEEAATQRGLPFRRNHAEIGEWYSSRRVAEKTAAFKVLIEDGSDRILGAHLLGPRRQP